MDTIKGPSQVIGKGLFQCVLILSLFIASLYLSPAYAPSPPRSAPPLCERYQPPKQPQQRSFQRPLRSVPLYLHTWSQTLIDHFHLHCLIPGGVLAFTKDKWLPASESFLFRVESLADKGTKRHFEGVQKTVPEKTGECLS